MELNIRKKDECRWDLISLGELLLRFCPGESRIQTANSFTVYDGGGEYNVARNLAGCFRQNTAIVTALADNQLGRLAENLARKGGVDVSQIRWRDADEFRNGLYFIERGFGNRPAASVFDRANTAISNIETGATGSKSLRKRAGCTPAAFSRDFPKQPPKPRSKR